MSKSNYGQVVFQDVADSYPNDAELICKFTLTELAPEIESGDKVGLFRVPNVNPDEAVAFVTVERPEVVFKADVLPKDEDFYQYQFVREEKSGEVKFKVIGASVPFQLRSPKGDELCAVEDDEEFMVVKSNTAAVSEQYKVNNHSLHITIRPVANTAIIAKLCYSGFRLVLITGGTSDLSEHWGLIQ